MAKVTVTVVGMPLPTTRGTGEIQNLWVQGEGFGFRAVAFRRPGERWSLLPLGQDTMRPWVAIKMISRQDGTALPQVDYEVTPEIYAQIQEQVSKLS